MTYTGVVPQRYTPVARVLFFKLLPCTRVRNRQWSLALAPDQDGTGTGRCRGYSRNRLPSRMGLGSTGPPVAEQELEPGCGVGYQHMCWSSRQNNTTRALGSRYRGDLGTNMCGTNPRKRMQAWDPFVDSEKCGTREL